MLLQSEWVCLHCSIAMSHALGLLNVTTKSRLPILEFSGYHCSFNLEGVLGKMLVDFCVKACTMHSGHVLQHLGLLCILNMNK